MISRLSCTIAKWCMKRSGQTDTELEVYAYGLECAIADFLQILALALVAVIGGCLPEIICFALCFTMMKQYVGGLHAKSHLACISIFTGIAAISISLLSLVDPRRCAVTTNVLALLQVVMIIFMKPVAHPNHPKSRRAHLHSRKASIRVAIAQLLILPLLSLLTPKVGLAGAVGGLEATLTLAFSKILNGRRLQK